MRDAAALRHATLRIARPVRDLGRSAAMYRDGLGLEEIGHFRDHDGFDGVMLGAPGLAYHLEFTVCRRHPIMPTPTPEDLVVFYLADRDEWARLCASVCDAGFVEVEPFNPYWRQRGRTFEDPDGYRLVLQREAWEPR